MFNRAILRTIADSPFMGHESVSDVMKELIGHRGDPAFDDNEPFDVCRDMIEILTQERGAELTEKLHYDMDQAIDILAGALGEYLDQRFSVTSRRLLGFGCQYSRSADPSAVQSLTPT